MSLETLDQSGSTSGIQTLPAQMDGSVIVPDSKLLFSGTFERSGSDLLIVNDGAETLFVPGYFLTEIPADLKDENGAVLRGDLVELLAGPIAPGQYAELNAAAGASPIGQVETLDGGASVQRLDGTVETLQVGMKIFQQDVVQTETGGSVSVTFVDGTIFTLASASRMVIDQLIYDPDSGDNSAAFSLIQGGFVFIAGQVARTGGMEVATPASTMGIRGTTVIVQLIADGGVITSETTLTTDPDGLVGEVALFDIAGNLIATITETDTKWIVSAMDGQTRELVRTAEDQREDSVLIAEAFAAFRAATSRVDAGDTFVTLSDPDGISQDLLQGENAETDLDVDGVDEPDAIDPLNDFEEAPEPTDVLPLDDTQNRLEDEVQTPTLIMVQGFEDAGEDGAISGQAEVENPSGLALVFGLGQEPSHGAATVNADGSFAFVPEPNFNGIDSFTFTVESPAGEIAQGTVVVEVLPVNDAPTANDSLLAMSEDGSISGAIDSLDIDGDTLSYSVQDAPAYGAVDLLEDGSFVYTPDADFAGADQFSVIVSDPDGASALATVAINVVGENDAPIVTTTVEDARGAITEDSLPGVVGGTLSATDIDTGDTLVWSGSATGVYGVFSVTTMGAWSYALTANAADSLAAGEQVTENFTALVTDTGGETDAIDIVVTVTGTNDAPIITSTQQDARGSLVEGDETITASGTLLAFDPDGSSDPVWSGTPSTAFGTFTISTDGEWTYTLDNGLADALKLGETTVESLVATAADGNGGTVEQLVEVTVTGTNDQPIVSSNVVFGTVEGQSLTGAFTASDVDSDLANLTFSLGDQGPQNGTVIISDDGSFDYTPDDGFLGLERFEYSVNDGQGGVTTGRVTIEVENDPNNPETKGVSVGLNTEATEGTAAGAVEILLEPTVASSVNLAIALDRSGSIGLPKWTELLEQVRDALTQLAEQFEGTDTTVDVKIITFGSNVDSTEKPDGSNYQLSDPELLELINPEGLPYRGGATAWDLAFIEVGDFFFSQPSTETNVLLFVTDGVPTTGAYAGPLDELRDPTDDFDVTISAFGFGQAYEEDELLLVDENATFLNDPGELAAAFQTAAIFNPQLVSFQVELEVDDGPTIVIADETSPSLLVEGTNFELPLASIENILDLLGESNRISTTALFDINNDPSDAEITVFSTDVIGKAATAKTSSGLGGDDLIFGSDEGDQLEGGAGNDILIAFDGDDTLGGGSGQDTIRGGDGDDRIVMSDANSIGDSIDGGAGRDSLAIEAIADINDLLSTLEASGIEVLDAANAQQDDLALSIEDIFRLSDTGDDILNQYLGTASSSSLSIYGDATDTLQLDGDGTYEITLTGQVEDDEGTRLNVYEFTQEGGNALATLGVETDIAVTTANVPVA